jgi:ABC-type multidrug transport system ATPase subunit
MARHPIGLDTERAKEAGAAVRLESSPQQQEPSADEAARQAGDPTLPASPPPSALGALSASPGGLTPPNLSPPAWNPPPHPPTSTGLDTSSGLGPHGITLRPGEWLTLGSAPDNHVILPDARVAPYQARLERGPHGIYTITDLTTQGGTFVNGIAVHQAPILQGAELAIGPYHYVLAGDHLRPRDERNSIQIDALNLEQSIRTGGLTGHRKILLDDVSLSIPPGSFVALIGGSGAGKTTLLTTLSGQNPPKRGSVLFNGVDLYQHATDLGLALGYVPQDDIIHKNLTVERALYYAARMRLPTRMSRQEIKQRVREVLDDIEMVPQSHQLISQLSGGQRKRVNIAVELLDHPPVLFLDEPTSGLDPGLDLRLTQLLRRLADRGHTVVLATHEMRDTHQCDYVCFLAPGGRLAYFGPPQELTRQFGTEDFATMYNLLYEEPDHWVAIFRQSPNYLRYVAGPRVQSETQSEHAGQRGVHTRNPRHDSSLRQLWLLTMRYLELIVRDRTTLLILLAQAPIIAILTTFLTDHNILATVAQPFHLGPPQDIFAQATLFILACSAIWFGTINAAREIVKEHSIYQRERAINLHILPYVCSKFLVLGALLAIQCFLLLYIVGLKSGYPRSGLFLPGIPGAFVEMYISLLLMGITGLTIGLLISALAPNTDRAVSFVPIVLIPEIIFANVIFSLKDVGVYISWVLPARWGMQALGSITRLRDRFTDHTSGPAFYVSNTEHLLGYWGALVGLVVFFFLLTLLFLKRKDIAR